MGGARPAPTLSYWDDVAVGARGDAIWRERAARSGGADGP